MQRWAVLIAEFGAPIRYIEGQRNIRADMLSRIRPREIDVVDTGNRTRRQSGFPTFILYQRQDANVLPKRRQLHQGDKLCDVSTVPLVARWPVFLALGSDADGEPHYVEPQTGTVTWSLPLKFNGISKEEISRDQQAEFADLWQEAQDPDNDTYNVQDEILYSCKRPGPRQAQYPRASFCQGGGGTP